MATRWRAWLVPPLLLSLAVLAAAEPAEDVPGLDADGTYLQPNYRLRDGTPAYLHVRPSDMPLRISVGYPKSPPKYAGREKTREVAIEAMRMWEKAIQPRLSWFRLEFVEDDEAAPVQVIWKRRIPGPWGGFGRITYRFHDDVLRIGGEMKISTTPAQRVTLTIDEVRQLVAHEFGHVLGLGHCLKCDSAMNYAWRSDGRVRVTEVDVRTFLKLVEMPLRGHAE